MYPLKFRFHKCGGWKMSKLYISMYHYTRDLGHSRYPKIKGLDKPLFHQQIEFLRIIFLLSQWSRCWMQ